jgi:ubiquinone/menaquinone biosynthesis C-methylase UbiE
MRRYSARIYDYVIVKMTSRWYDAVISEFPAGAMILDVGIGTGSALVCNKLKVQAKGLHFLGIDYNSTYVSAARNNMEIAGLSNIVQVMQGSIYEVATNPNLPKDYKCDVVYFSGSFSLMPSPSDALKVTARLLKPGGKIYITQTFQKKATPGMAFFKPLLKYLTTIDFGELVMEKDVVSMIEAAGMRVERWEKIPGSVDNVWQAAYLVVIDPQI